MNKKERYIVVPKDKIAEIELDFDRANADQLIELVLSEDDFNMLFKNGVFDLINHHANVILDDYEDSNITEIDKIHKVIKYLEIKKNSSNEILKSKIDLIVFMLKESLDRNTGIYFYF